MHPVTHAVALSATTSPGNLPRLLEIILVDEGHSLVVEGNAAATKDVFEFLKSLLNRIGRPIVIAGLPHLLQLRGKRIDKQTARRLHPSARTRRCLPVARPLWTSPAASCRWQASTCC